MLSDIQIAQSTRGQSILEIGAKLGLEKEQLIPYGWDKAKINDLGSLNPNGKLILVTAINPTPAGEGKTTTSIGLADSLQALGYKTALALREPSLGPVFGLKGGAAGGGYAQVIPMEDINLHFTGDFHAVSAAHNLIAAVLDNHIYQGNALEIDYQSIAWKRVVDMNDRQLRHIISGLQGRMNGQPREDGFDITVASEIMAIICLAEDLMDLKDRVGRIVLGRTTKGKPVLLKELEIEGAVCLLLKDAIKPNLVQTLEGTPAFLHGGPFANIAHGCNSIIATKTAMHLADYVVTEAGFGADLGAEKFIDIKCRSAKIQPSALVLVATIRALKMHGGLEKHQLDQIDLNALEKGLPLLSHHITTIQSTYHTPVLVALNLFPTDAKEEIDLIRQACLERGVQMVESSVFKEGSQGGLKMAKEVIQLINQEEPINLTYAYPLDISLEEKLNLVVQRVYGGKAAILSAKAQKELDFFIQEGYEALPICMAKTPISLSDQEKNLGKPEDFIVTIRELRLAAGAGFIVAIAGNIMTMPGLPKQPAATKMDINRAGKIKGLF